MAEEDKNNIKQQAQAARQLRTDKRGGSSNQTESAPPSAASADKNEQERGRELSQQQRETRSQNQKEDKKNNLVSTKSFQKLAEKSKRGGKEISIMQTILYALLMIFAIIIDLINITGISTVVDWIADIIFWFAAFIVTFRFTFDSFFMKRVVVNSVTTLAEIIPIVDILPFHMLAVVIMYLDEKYGILKV